MYYPIQLPFILSKKFARNLTYKEEVIAEYQDFIICIWEIVSLQEYDSVINNIIVPDGCIDLVVDYEARQIGFSGMSETNFNFEITHPARSYGVRLKPGSFYQLTNISAVDVMDKFIPLDIIDSTFCMDSFFSLSFAEGKEFLKTYLLKRIDGILPSTFVSLFDTLTHMDTLINAVDLYKTLNFSPRQCQRLFLKHYGISPKMVLSVIRFQQCLKILTSKNIKQSDVISIVGYYDQPHYIKDIKKNIGITPLDLIKRYQ